MFSLTPSPGECSHSASGTEPRNRTSCVSRHRLYRPAGPQGLTRRGTRSRRTAGLVRDPTGTRTRFWRLRASCPTHRPSDHCGTDGNRTISVRANPARAFGMSAVAQRPADPAGPGSGIPPSEPTRHGIIVAARTGLEPAALWLTTSRSDRWSYRAVGAPPGTRLGGGSRTLASGSQSRRAAVTPHPSGAEPGSRTRTCWLRVSCSSA